MQVAIPRAVLEKIYLSPPTDVKGDFRNTFANPTPLGLVGFLVATMPVAFQLMGWHHSGGGGAATIALSFYFGGILQLIASVMEWFLGNTLSFLIFGAFGAAWLALSSSSMFNAEGAYTALAHTPTEVAAAEAEFNSSFAFGLITFGLLTLTFAFCALRTNVIFVFCFFLVTVAIFIFAASYWALADGHTDVAIEMQKVVGAMFFVCCICGWYLLVANLLEVLEFGFSLPIGNLSDKLGRVGKGKMPIYRDRSKSV